MERYMTRLKVTLGDRADLHLSEIEWCYALCFLKQTQEADRYPTALFLYGIKGVDRIGECK